VKADSAPFATKGLDARPTRCSFDFSMGKLGKPKVAIESFCWEGGAVRGGSC
jgi:hypothetical protein